MSACAGAPDMPRDDDPLCNLLYAALAVEAGASVVSLDHRERYPEVRLDTRSFDREALAGAFESLARSVRELPPAPTHKDLARAFTASIIRKVDVRVRKWKREVKEGRATSPQVQTRPPVERAKILGPLAPPPPRPKNDSAVPA